MWCNTEAATPPQPLHKCGQHGGARLLRKGLILIYYIFIPCIVLGHGPRNRPLYFLLTTHFLDVGIGKSSVDHAGGGVGGVLASLTTIVKECCGSSFL